MAIPSKTLEIRYSKIYNNYVNEDIKIASISDVHISNAITTNDIDYIIETVKKESPNYICTLGDMIDYPRILDNELNRLKCKRLYAGLSKIAPVYIIFGNHDFINYDHKDKYLENFNEDFWNDLSTIKNINIINDKKVILKDVIISGYLEKRNIYQDKTEDTFYNDYSSIKDLKVNNSSKPKIIIMHSPEPFEDPRNIELVNNYNIVLCGHYHNGCVPAFLNKVMPKNSGIITPTKKVLPKNVRGIRKISNNTFLIYNGGWTKIPNNTPKPIHVLDKICNRQIDITILTKNISKEIEIKTKKIKMR